MSDRTFATHQIRRAVPVPTLWDFAALDTDAPVPARLPVPKRMGACPCAPQLPRARALHDPHSLRG